MLRVTAVLVLAVLLIGSAQAFTCPSFALFNYGTASCDVYLQAGELLTASTCQYGGYLLQSGSIYLTLEIRNANLQTVSDAPYSCQSPYGYYNGRTVSTTALTSGVYTIVATCDSTSCSGQVAYARNGDDGRPKSCGQRTDCVSCQRNSTCGWCGTYGETTSYGGFCTEKSTSYYPSEGNYRPLATCPTSTPWNENGQCTAQFCQNVAAQCQTCLAYSNCIMCGGSCYGKTNADNGYWGINCYASRTTLLNTTDKCGWTDCSSYTYCGSCTGTSTAAGPSSNQCSWCHASGQCLTTRSTSDASAANAQCAYGLLSTCPSTSSCAWSGYYYAYTGASTCAACTQLVQCGWCNSTKSCSAGTSSGPSTGTCTGQYAQWEVYSNNTCPAAPYTDPNTSNASSVAAAIGGGVAAGVFFICVVSIMCVVWQRNRMVNRPVGWRTSPQQMELKPAPQLQQQQPSMHQPAAATTKVCARCAHSSPVSFTNCGTCGAPFPAPGQAVATGPTMSPVALAAQQQAYMAQHQAQDPKAAYMQQQQPQMMAYGGQQFSANPGAAYGLGGGGAAAYGGYGTATYMQAGPPQAQPAMPYGAYPYGMQPQQQPMMTGQPMMAQPAMAMAVPSAPGGGAGGAAPQAIMVQPQPMLAMQAQPAMAVPVAMSTAGGIEASAPNAEAPQNAGPPPSYAPDVSRQSNAAPPPAYNEAANVSSGTA